MLLICVSLEILNLGNGVQRPEAYDHFVLWR